MRLLYGLFIIDESPTGWRWEDVVEEAAMNEPSSFSPKINGVLHIENIEEIKSINQQINKSFSGLLKEAVWVTFGIRA